MGGGYIGWRAGLVFQFLVFTNNDSNTGFEFVRKLVKINNNMAAGLQLGLLNSIVIPERSMQLRLTIINKPGEASIKEINRKRTT
jgi:putative flippase GtrA